MKSIDQVVKEQLGSLLFEVAILTSQDSEKADMIKKLQAELEESKKRPGTGQTIIPKEVK